MGRNVIALSAIQEESKEGRVEIQLMDRGLAEWRDEKVRWQEDREKMEVAKEDQSSKELLIIECTRKNEHVG